MVHGSGFGPMNFITAITSLNAASPANRLLKYADDCYLLIPSSNSASVTLELDHISRWAADCNLKLNQKKTSEMIIHRPRVGLGNLTAPGTTTGLARVTSMVILGVTISDDLRFNNHVQRLCCQARQSFYALRTLVAHGLRGLHLYDVVRATTLARMLYASPAWWGFVGQRDKDRFEVLMRRLIRYHYLPGDSLSFEQLCIKADSRLFSSILVDNGHVLHELLPPIKTSKYSLRPRAHDRIIPPADNLMRKNFITRMIYKV